MNNKRVKITVIAGLCVGLGIASMILISLPSDSDSKDNSTDTSAAQINGTNINDQSAMGTNESEWVQSTKIDIKDYAYSPETVTVKIGETVTWTNQDSVGHDVVMDDDAAGGPNSELLAKGESYSYTFTRAGTYAYHCSPHPYMKATVIVEE